MSAEAVIGPLVGLFAAAATYLTVIRPRWATWRERRHRRYLGLTYLLEGKPETVDERGLVSPGYPSITVTLNTLAEQLTRNGGASMADAIDRIEGMAQSIAEARNLAGEAAAAAGRVEQQATENHRATNALRAEVDVYTDLVRDGQSRLRRELRDAGIELPDD